MEKQTEGISYIYDEKRKFTPQEFLIAQIASDFIIDFTKVICSCAESVSGLENVHALKDNLFSSFQKSIGIADEITLTCRESAEKADVFIIGILDEPVSSRRVMKSANVEMFIPKLKDYFDRNGIMSITVKRQITSVNFDSFTNLMCEHHDNFTDAHQINQYLTQALVDANISEVLIVFKDDAVIPERILSWRVLITLYRIVKDLNVVQMYHHESADDIKKISIGNVHNDLKTLKYADLIKDVIINTDIIIRNVMHLNNEELKEIIVFSIPIDALLSTTGFFLDEYENLKKKQKIEKRRSPQEFYDDIEDILRIASYRIISEEVPESFDLLERLYNHGLITAESLPRDHILIQLRKRIATTKSQGKSIFRRLWFRST